MLSLVNKYGLSHVCANPEFENIEHWGDGKDGDRDFMFNFPYLDMYIQEAYFSKNWPETSMAFFLRGTKDKEWKFQNLFEYLYWTSLHGSGLKYLLLKSVTLRYFFHNL